MSLSWLRSYLTDRYQFVDGNVDFFMCTKVRFCVPQGPVLDSLPFSLYTCYSISGVNYL